MEQEVYSRYKQYTGWTNDPEPLFRAVEAVIAAGALPEDADVTVQLRWEDRHATYKSLASARERLQHAERPEGVRVEGCVESVESADDEDAPPVVRVNVDIGGAQTIHVFASGTDWSRAPRAYEIVTSVVESEAVALPPPPPESQLLPSVADLEVREREEWLASTPQSPVQPDRQTIPTLPPAEKRGGARQWMNDNQGLLAGVSIVVAVVLGVITLLVT